jgi:voltage-gated potassium channel
MAANSERKPLIYRIIFGTDTPAGRLFDVLLLGAILLSVLIVMLESVESFRVNYRSWLTGIEWGLTLLFTAEYLLRLYCVPSKKRYAFSFFGIIDLLAILPTYLDLLLSGAHYLIVIRILRLIRIFRIFKLIRYMSEAHLLMQALRASRRKITVFLGSVLTLVIVLGTLMYLIEGEESGFNSIPRGIYWAIVTLSTVGYGDVIPQTVPGQVIACMVMIIGYGIIAVPTGIVSVELHQAAKHRSEGTRCSGCARTGHELDADFCRFCGAPIENQAPNQDSLVDFP